MFWSFFNIIENEGPRSTLNSWNLRMFPLNIDIRWKSVNLEENFLNSCAHYIHKCEIFADCNLVSNVKKNLYLIYITSLNHIQKAKISLASNSFRYTIYMHKSYFKYIFVNTYWNISSKVVLKNTGNCNSLPVT